MAEKEKLNLSVHNEYLKNESNWVLWEKLVQGEHSELVGDPNILWRHHQELKPTLGDSLLTERKSRTRYLNIPELILSIWVSFFFRNPPVLSKDAQALLGEWSTDIDGDGTSFITFLSDSLGCFLKHGKVGALVDKLEDGRTFASLINPLDIVDWSVERTDPDRVGEYNFVRITSNKEASRQRATQPFSSEQVSNEFYMSTSESGELVYKNQEYKLEDSNVAQKDRQWFVSDEPAESEVSKIPFVCMSGKSWIKDVAQETLRHFNLRSSKDSIEQAQAYQKNFIIGIDGNDAKQVSAVTEHVYPLLPTGASVTTIGAVNTATLKESIAEALDSAFKVGLNQLRQVASGSKAVQAADTINEERDERIALVQATMEKIENYANQILELFAIYEGSEEDSTKDYSLKFDTKVTGDDIDSFIAVYNAFKDLLLKYPDVENKAVDKIIEHLFDASTKDDLMKDIEAQRKSEAELPKEDPLFGDPANPDDDLSDEDSDEQDEEGNDDNLE